MSAVEVIEKTNRGLLNFFFGEPEATHAKAIEFWKNGLSSGIPSSRFERILFGSGGRENDRSLSESLSRSLFNIVQNLALEGDTSKVCMLAECSEGLGSDALLRYVTGTFVPGKTLDEIKYFDGLETLISLIRVQKELEISIVSTLPAYYASRLDFKNVIGARDAPHSILPTNSKGKIAVVPDASSIFFTTPNA